MKKKVGNINIKNYYSFGLVVFLCLLNKLSFSQVGFQNPDEKPLEREMEFLEMRKLSNGHLPELWTEFIKVKERALTKSAAVPTANWVNLGPDGLDSLTGRMTCHSFNPFNSQIILAGSAGGGLWRTNDGGNNWSVLTDDLPSLRISAVAFNPNDTNHILLGTGFYYNSSTSLPGIGILESFDGGSTWLPGSFSYPFSSGISVNRIIWDNQNVNNVYLAASNGIWISRNMGLNWTLSMAGNYSDLDIIKTSPKVLFASRHSVGIYKSIDSASTWTQVTVGLPTSIHRISLASSDSFPNFLVASFVKTSDTSLEGLYRSSDGGQTWANVPGAPTLCMGSTCQGWFVNQLAVSPVDTNIILLGGHRFWVTNDGGFNWLSKDYYNTSVPGGSKVGLAYVDQFDFGFDPLNPSTVYAFNDGGIFKSNDNGLFWQKKNRGIVTALVYQFSSCAVDSSKLIMATQDLGLHYLDHTGGNISWKLWLAGDGTDVAYDPLDANKAYGDAPFGTHKRNNLVSSGWQNTLNFNSGIIGNNTVPIHLVLTHHPSLSNVLYTANDTRIFKTNNALTWTTVATLSNIRSIAISEKLPSTIYASAYNSFSGSHTFYNSFDDGYSWNPTSTSPGWRVTDIEPDPNNHGVVYVTRNSSSAGNPHVYKSHDHGNTWNAISSGLPDVSTNAITVNPFDSNMVYVGTDLGVFISEDGGMNWNDYNSNLPPYYVTDMHFHKLDSTLRVSTLGRGIWKTKSIPTIALNNTKVTDESFELNLYPNPFTDEVKIVLTIKNKMVNEIRILNVLGQAVKTLYSGKALSIGEHCFVWAGVNEIDKYVSPGVFFLEVKSSSKKQSYRIVKL